MTDTNQQALRERLPLPLAGVYSARYVDDMREVVAYRILSDDLAVRYDWLDNGIRCSHLEKPITYTDLSPDGLKSSIDDQLALRRAACLKYRGITP